MKKEILKGNNKIGIIALVLIAFICVITTSYALWMFLVRGTKENSIKSATLILNLDETSVDGVSLLNSVPMSDEKAKTLEAYTFNLKNTGSITAKYKLYIDDDEEAYNTDNCSDKKLSWSKIRYEFKKNDDTAIVDNLENTEGVLDDSALDSNATNSYTLRLWISQDASNEVMGKHFHGKIRIEAVQNE